MHAVCLKHDSRSQSGHADNIRRRIQLSLKKNKQKNKNSGHCVAAERGEKALNIRSVQLVELMTSQNHHTQNAAIILKYILQVKSIVSYHISHPLWLHLQLFLKKKKMTKLNILIHECVSLYFTVLYDYRTTKDSCPTVNVE